MGLQQNALTTLAAMAAELNLSAAQLPSGIVPWAASSPFATNALVEPPRPNGRYYKNTGTSGTSGSTQPVWPFTTGGTVVDAGGIVWTDQGPSLQGRLERLINSSADAFERYCNRKFVYGQWTENLGTHGTNFLMVGRLPLYSIVSISFDGAVLQSNEYEIYEQVGTEPSQTGKIYRQIGWTWTANYVLSAQPYRLPGSESDDYQVVYNAGYQTPQFDGQVGINGAPAMSCNLPADLEQAAIEHVVSMYRRAGWDRNNVSEGFGDSKLQRYADAEQIPKELIPVLDRYRRIW